MLPVDDAHHARVPSAAGEDGRENQNDIDDRKCQQVLPLNLAAQQEQQQRWDEKHGLQLEGEAGAHSCHTQPGTILQRHRDAQHCESDIDAVALTPERAVENHGRPEQNEKKRKQLSFGTFCEMAGNAHDAPGEDHVEENAQELDEVEILDCRLAEEGEERQIRHIIVSDAFPERGQTAVLPEIVNPGRKEILIVQRLIIQTDAAQQEGERKEPARQQHMPRLFEHAGQLQQRQRQYGLCDEQKIYGDIQNSSS